MALNTNKREGDKLHAEEWNELVQEVQRKQPRLNIVDALDSDSNVDVLSAKQGKRLKGMIDNATTNVNNVADVVKTLPVGYFYGTYDTEEELPTEITEQGYAYVGTGNPYIIYTYDTEIGWSQTDNKYSTPALETNLSTKSQIKAPTTKAVQEGIEAIDVTLARSAENENELTATQKYNASANINDRAADVAPVTNEVKAFGYKVLNPTLSFTEQVTEDNTIYEIKDEFDIDDSATASISTSEAITINGVVYYASTNTIELQVGKYISVPESMYLLSGNDTLLPPFYINNGSESAILKVASFLQYNNIPYTYGTVVSIPQNCELKFNGGRIVGGVLDLNGAKLEGTVYIDSEPAWNMANEFQEGYKPSNLELHTKWFGVKGDGEADDAVTIKRCIKWLHKDNASLIFENNSVCILGDGIQDADGDPFKVLHTGYSYPTDHFHMTGVWPSGVSKDSYIKNNPANLGRDIVLRFFRFTHLTVAGNGTIIKSNDNNGYSKNNEIFRFVGCDDCKIDNFQIDGNREERVGDNKAIDISLISDLGYHFEISSIDDLTQNSYYSILCKNIIFSGITLPTQIFAGFRQVQNIAVWCSNNITITNITSYSSLMDSCLIVGVPSSYVDSFVIDSSVFSHCSRHCFSTSEVKNGLITNSIFEYAGIALDNSTSFRMGGCSLVDLESDYHTANTMNVSAGIDNVIFDSCIFRYSAKNGLLFNYRCQNSKVLNSKFINKGITCVKSVGAFNNEVAYCTFEQAFCNMGQEGTYIHDNTFHFNYNTYPLFSTTDSYEVGDIVTYLGVAYMFKNAHQGNWSAGDVTIYAYGFKPDAINNSYKLGWINGVSENQSTTYASEKIGRFENNVISMDYTGGYLPLDTTFRITDNIKIDNNTFLNCYAEGGGTTLVSGGVVSFRKNIFRYETDKYPVFVSQKLPRVDIRPFNGTYDIGLTTNIGLRVDDNYSLTSEICQAWPITGGGYKYFYVQISTPTYIEVIYANNYANYKGIVSIAGSSALHKCEGYYSLIGTYASDRNGTFEIYYDATNKRVYIKASTYQGGTGFITFSKNLGSSNIVKAYSMPSSVVKLCDVTPSQSTTPTFGTVKPIKGTSTILADGRLIVFNGTAWTDASGILLTEIQVSDKSVLLQAAANSSQTIEVYTSDTPTPTIDTDASSWLSASLNGTTLTITAITSNETSTDNPTNPRGGKIVLSNSTDEVVINVVQNYV